MTANLDAERPTGNYQRSFCDHLWTYCPAQRPGATIGGMSSPAAQIDVAAEVRAQLARAQYTGSRIARELGWTQRYMSRRLTGEVPFDVNDLAAIAEVLGVPVSSFFDALDFERGQLTAQPPGRRPQLRKELLSLFDLHGLELAA